MSDMLKYGSQNRASKEFDATCINIDKRSRESANVSVLVLCYCIYIICSVCITLCIFFVTPLAFTLLSLYCLGSTLNTSVYTVYICVYCLNCFIKRNKSQYIDVIFFI